MGLRPTAVLPKRLHYRIWRILSPSSTAFCWLSFKSIGVQTTGRDETFLEPGEFQRLFWQSIRWNLAAQKARFAQTGTANAAKMPQLLSLRIEE